MMLGVTTVCRNIWLLVILSLVTGIASAEDVIDEELRAIGVEMSKCYGAQQAFADVVAKTQGKASVDKTSGIARATRLAARYLFHLAGISEEKLDAAVDAYSYKTKNDVAVDMELSFSEGKNPDYASEILTECNDRWMPLQEQIIEDIRKNIYR